MKETGARRGYDERRFLNQVWLVVHNSVSGVGVGYDHRSGHVPGSGGQHFADPGPKRRLRSGTPTRVTLAPPRIKKKSKSGNEFLETQKKTNKQTNKQSNGKETTAVQSGHRLPRREGPQLPDQPINFDSERIVILLLHFSLCLFCFRLWFNGIIKDNLALP